MARYLPWDADFALDAELGDEDLPLPRDLDAPWFRRARIPAYVLVALLAAGVVTLRVRGEDAAPVTVAAPTAEPIQIRDVSQPLRRSAGGLVSDDLIDVCPAAASCRTSSAIPAAVTAALHATFPAYSDPTVRTVTVDEPAGPRLLGRYVHVVTAADDVTVQVLPTLLPRTATLSGSGSAAIAVVQRAVGTATVRVTIGGEDASTRPGSAPVRLAADARMLQL